MPILPSPSPGLTLELRQLLESDYAVPALWDPDKQILLDNDAYLYARVEAIKTGVGLDANSINDARLGNRNINDGGSAPVSASYDNVLTHHLQTIATRIKAIMGTAAWSSAVPATLSSLGAHPAATSVHEATSAATPNRIIMRDASGRARVAAPIHADDIARKADVDAIAIGDLNFDDRYYTQTVLGASGGAGTNIVHADRIGAGTLADARIPNLNASKITAGTLADARIPNLNTSKINAGTLPVARGGTGLASITGNNFIRGNGAGGYIERTPTQALADMGGLSGAHTHAWAEITSKPSTFTPSSHTHATGDITSGTLDLARIPTITPAKTSFFPTFSSTAQVYTVRFTGSGTASRNNGWTTVSNNTVSSISISHNFGTTNYSVLVGPVNGATVTARITSLALNSVSVAFYNPDGTTYNNHANVDVLLFRW